MKHTYGLNYLRKNLFMSKKRDKKTSSDFDPKKIFEYKCTEYGSVGRTIGYLVKRFKDKDIENCSAIVIHNIENLVFKRDPVEAFLKYKRFYDAGNQTKGHFTPKTTIGLFNKLLRNNLKYRTLQKKLYKKICILSEADYLLFKKLNMDTKLLTESGFKQKIRPNYFGLKIKLGELIPKL